MNVEGLPRPDPGPLEAPFWAACRAHELRIQRCTACGRFRHHPTPRCPSCRSDAYEWAVVSGRGTVYSYTVCHPPVLPAFADDTPYNAIVVQLEEGPFLVSNLLGIDDDAITIGMAVEVSFTDIDADLTLPHFRAR